MSRIPELQEKVSAKFAEIHTKYKSEMQCAEGCHECCKPGLSVSIGEARLIKEFIDTTPGKREELQSLAQTKPHRGKRCDFLDAKGSCAVYAVRPIICRSHGAPIQFRDPDARNPEKAERFRDVCPLNLKDKSLKDFPLEDILNLDTVNMLLTMVNKQEFGKNEARFLLTLAVIDQA